MVCTVLAKVPPERCPQCSQSALHHGLRDRAARCADTRHCGIQGNGQAVAAALSDRNGISFVTIPLSRFDAAKELCELARQLMLNLWSSPTFSDDLHFQVICFMHCTLTCNCASQPTSHAMALPSFSNAYSFTIEMADSPSSELCGHRKTIAHFICECTRFNSEIAALQPCLLSWTTARLPRTRSCRALAYNAR